MQVWSKEYNFTPWGQIVTLPDGNMVKQVDVDHYNDYCNAKERYHAKPYEVMLMAFAVPHMCTCYACLEKNSKRWKVWE